MDGDSHRENLQDARDFLNFGVMPVDLGASCLDRTKIARPSFEGGGIRARFETGGFVAFSFENGVGDWKYLSSHTKGLGFETDRADITLNQLAADLYVEEISLAKISVSANILVWGNIVAPTYEGASGVYLDLNGSTRSPICPTYSDIIPAATPGNPSGGMGKSRWRGITVVDLVILQVGWNRISARLDAKHDTCVLTGGTIIVDGRSA